jgi:DNA polymerase III subunit delta
VKFDLDRALRHTVVLLAGEEPVWRMQALSDLVEAAAGGDDFDLEGFVGDSSSPVEWLASAGTAPFLSPRRTAVVRNLLRNVDAAQLAGATLPDSALLILVADEEPKTDNENKRGSTVPTWQKQVEKMGGMVYAPKLDSSAVAKQLREDATEEGRDLQLPAAELLRDMCGGSYSRARNELDKVILFAGDEKKLTQGMVQAVTVPSREWNIFNLTKAVTEGATPDAMRTLHGMVGAAAKAESVAFASVIPMMSRQFRMLYQARVTLDFGGNLNNIPDAAKRTFPNKPNLAEEKEYPRKLSFEAAKRLPLPKLARALDVISLTDARMKGQEASFTAMDTLERMILELIEALR